MNPSIQDFKEQVAPHVEQVKTEGRTRVKRLREIGTQSSQEAISEVKAGFQSLRSIGGDALQVLKSIFVQNVQATKTKGISTAQSLRDEQIKRAKNYVEALDSRLDEKHGSTYRTVKQKLQQAKTRYSVAKQQMQNGKPSSYQTTYADVDAQAQKAATTVVQKEEQIKQVLKTTIQNAFQK